MRGIVIRDSGGPEVLEYRTLPEPEHGPEEVRVRVRATALNRADLLQRRGLYPAPPGAPSDVPGLEFAGEVEAAGALARRFRPGDRVMGIVPGGGHAERVVLHERLCLEIPPALDWEQAAAVPEAFLTAFDALFDRARLSAGECVLVHAAASGVGTAAVQLATAAGARVIGLSRSPSKRDRLSAIGAGAALDPAGPDVAGRIRVAAGAGGVDVVVDLVGAAAWPVNLDVLATCGRIVLVGLLGGARVEVDLADLLRRRATVVGTVLRSRPLEQRIALTQRFGRQMLPLLADGRLKPVVDRSFPLAEAAEAHRFMESNAHFGKIVLAVG